MELAPSTRLGPFEIVAPIGSGGMGEVYRARDTRLERSVAIKVLPAAFALDAQFRLRLEREAKTISQLNHPHICALYDIGHDAGRDYLVMELIEGESLADRLRKGPLPLDQVLRYGAELADALDRAHKSGVVHRDLKPGNIMITKSGAKLLDFGLAKPQHPTPSLHSSILETQQKPLTQEGTILGTFQYMAPEQLEGLDADCRTDLFALGAVLYEMATGRRAFEGKTKTSLIAAIVDRDPPPMSALQPVTPPALEEAVARCLAKDPDQRWQCAADLRWELRRIERGTSGTERPQKSRFWAAAAAGLAVAASAALAAALLMNRPETAGVARFTVHPPEGWTIVLNNNAGPPAVSPDGRQIAFVASEGYSGRTGLFVRDLQSLDIRLLPATDGAATPFWSPDGQSLGFGAGGKLKRVDLRGGRPQTLCDAGMVRGGVWMPDGTIIFSPSTRTPLYRVSAAGGKPVPVTRLDEKSGETSHRWPMMLPDQRRLLFLSNRSREEGSAASAIHAVTIADGVMTPPLLEVISNVGHAAGYLVYARDRTLFAHDFDRRNLEFEGHPQPLAREVEYHPSGFSMFSVNGHSLVYQAGTLESQLLWIGRDGASEEILSGERYVLPRISSDQRWVVYAVIDRDTGNEDIWVYDLTRNVSRRLTHHVADDFSGLPTPDGKHVVFASNRRGMPDIYIKAIDGSGEERLVTAAETANFPESVSADGSLVLYRVLSPGQTQADIWVTPLSGGKPFPLVTSPFNDIQPVLSGSGRWFAYTSNESGKYEVYAAPFPAGTPRVQISSDGGWQPVWRADEKELFYLARDGRLTAVPIATAGGKLEVGTPSPIAAVRLRLSRSEMREYDVSADGQRFIVNSAAGIEESLPLTVVLNWQSERNTRR